ncbi:MAG TPA: hypothetical protein VIX89_17230 [Bryobacteraceae bacterium]
MLLRVTAVFVAIASFCAADVLTLRSGQVVRGEYLGGDSRHVKMAVGDRVESYSVDEVTNLQFGGGQRLNDQDGRDRREGGFREPPPPPPPPPASYSMQIPAGTPVTVRMIDGVDSEQTRLGQTFRASIDEPVLVDGQTVIPRGADAVAKLVEDKESGKFAGKTILTLALMQVMVNGRMIDISTGDVSQASGSRGARTAKVVGGTAALGAIIGGIAGGGKGAAIGAGSGAAVGGGIELMTKGQRVRIPSETRLTFTLQQPANI